MDEMDAMTSRMNEARNIVEQTRDCAAACEAGAIDEEEYFAAQGKKNACLRVIAMLDRGEAVDDATFAEMIAEETEKAAEPTPLEILRADVDYALMLGGEM